MGWTRSDEAIFAAASEYEKETLDKVVDIKGTDLHTDTRDAFEIFDPQATRASTANQPSPFNSARTFSFLSGFAKAVHISLLSSHPSVQEQSQPTASETSKPARRAAVDQQNPPFIPPEEVAEHNTMEKGIWIIIDDRVYDVTNFMDKHPGKREPIEQFAGQQCTWQFNLFHNPQHLKAYSRSLLIGRTYPVPPNPYPEPPRFLKPDWEMI